MHKFLFSVLLFCSIYTLQAQEQRVFSQFFMNPYIYNPAYAGVEGHTAFFLMYRNQWTGINGSPNFYHINFHTPLRSGLSIGALAFSEQESVLRTSGLKATLGYLTVFSKKHYLRFGISLGAGRTSLDLNQLDIPFNDPAFSSLLNSSNYAIVDFGLAYHIGHFNFGFSIPNLISKEVLTKNSFSKVNISPTDNLLFKVNYRGHIIDQFAIEPHLVYRYSSVNASQYEAAVIFHVKHIVWLGASFRQDAGLIGLVGFKIKEKIGIGYAYDLGNSNIRSFTGSTHEVHLGFHIGIKKKHHPHSQSFIKSHRLSAEERAELAEKKRQEELAALQPDIVEEPIENQSIEEVTKDNDISFEEDNENNDTIVDNSEVDSELVDDVKTIIPDDNIVKRGNHILELPKGNHVIAGAFQEFEHAGDYSDELFKKGFYQTIVGYVTAKEYYYTVVFNSPNLAVAESQKEKIKKMKGMEKVWILVIE